MATIMQTKLQKCQKISNHDLTDVFLSHREEDLDPHL